MILESERLLIRAVKISDAPHYFQLFTDKDWITYISDKGIKSVEETETFLINFKKIHPEKLGLGYFTVFLKKTNKPIGVSTALHRDSLDFIDVGYGFLPDARGKGYATEATKLMLNYIKETFQQEKVLAFTKPKNESSQKLLQNLNFTYIGEKIIFGTEKDAVYEFVFT